MAALATIQDVIPVVQTTADRDARFSNPFPDQRVQNKQTSTIQRWEVSLGAWVDDFYSLAPGTPLAPGAAGGYIRSNGVNWVRVQGIAAADVQSGTFAGAPYIIRVALGSDALVWGGLAPNTTSGRLRTGGVADMIDMSSNLPAAGGQDDVAKSSWRMRMGPGADLWAVARTPPGGVEVTFATITSTGALVVGTDPGVLGGAKLRVGGNAVFTNADTSDGGIILVSADATNKLIFFANNGGPSQMRVVSNHALEFWTNNTVRLTLAASGASLAPGAVATTDLGTAALPFKRWYISETGAAGTKWNANAFSDGALYLGRDDQSNQFIFSPSAFNPRASGTQTLGGPTQTWGKLYLGLSSFSNARGFLNIRTDNAVDNAIYLEDSNAAPKASWAIGLSTGGSFDGIGFYNYTAAALRLKLLASGELDVIIGPVIVGTSTQVSTAGSLVTADNANAKVEWQATGQAADNRVWDFLTAATGLFRGRARNDANNAATNWIEVSRTGTTINYVQFPNSVVTIGSQPAVNTANLFMYTNTVSASGAPVVQVSDNAGSSLASNYLGYSFGTLDAAFVGIRGRGTYASPTAVQSDDFLVTFAAGGQYDSTVGHVTGGSAGWAFLAAENWTSGAQGVYLRLYLTKPTTAATAEYYRWRWDSYTPSVSGAASLGTTGLPWGNAYHVNAPAGAIQWQDSAAGFTNPGYIFYSSSNALTFGTQNVDRWTIDNAGNLIGSTTNGGYLSVRMGSSSVRGKVPTVMFLSTGCATTSTTTATLTGGTNGGTCQLKANALSANGDSLEITFSGDISATTGTVTLEIGSIVFVNAVALSSAGTFYFTVKVSRVDSTHVRVTGMGISFNAANVTYLNRTAGSVSLDLTTDQNILFRGAAASGTLTGYTCQVMLQPAP